jgi:serine/threonine protein kinase
MVNYRLNIEKDKNLLDYAECKKLIVQEKISNIGKGGQGDIFKVVSDKCGSVVLKLFRENVSLKLNLGGNYNLNQKMKDEYEIMCMIKILIDYRYCANFVDIIDFDPEKKYIILEYADGDCDKLIHKEQIHNINYDILCSFVCQVLIGLLCFQKLINMWHNDFKLKNILYKKINKNIILHYKINSEDFYIPTFGYLFMIADFGMCIDKTFLKRKPYAEYIDIDRLIESLNKTNDGEDSDIKKIMAKLKERIPILELIKKHFKNFIKNNNYDTEYVETFVFNY